MASTSIGSRTRAKLDPSARLPPSESEVAADEGGGSKFVAPPPPVPLRTAPGTHDTPPSDAESGAHAVSPGKSPLSSPAMGRSYYVGRRAIGLGPRTEDPQTAWELHGSADMRDRYIPNPDVEARMEFAPMESTLPSSDKPVGIVRGGIVTHAVVACRQGANQRVIRCTVKASPGLAMNVRNRNVSAHWSLVTEDVGKWFLVADDTNTPSLVNISLIPHASSGSSDLEFACTMQEVVCRALYKNDPLRKVRPLCLQIIFKNKAQNVIAASGLSRPFVLRTKITTGVHTTPAPPSCDTNDVDVARTCALLQPFGEPARRENVADWPTAKVNTIRRKHEPLPDKPVLISFRMDKEADKEAHDLQAANWLVSMSGNPTIDERDATHSGGSGAPEVGIDDFDTMRSVSPRVRANASGTVTAGTKRTLAAARDHAAVAAGTEEKSTPSATKRPRVGSASSSDISAANASTGPASKPLTAARTHAPVPLPPSPKASASTSSASSTKPAKASSAAATSKAAASTLSASASDSLPAMPYLPSAFTYNPYMSMGFMYPGMPPAMSMMPSLTPLGTAGAATMSTPFVWPHMGWGMDPSAYTVKSDAGTQGSATTGAKDSQFTFPMPPSFAVMPPPSYEEAVKNYRESGAAEKGGEGNTGARDLQFAFPMAPSLTVMPPPSYEEAMKKFRENGLAEKGGEGSASAAPALSPDASGPSSGSDSEEEEEEAATAAAAAAAAATETADAKVGKEVDTAAPSAFQPVTAPSLTANLAGAFPYSMPYAYPVPIPMMSMPQDWMTQFMFMQQQTMAAAAAAATAAATATAAGAGSEHTKTSKQKRAKPSSTSSKPPAP